MRNHRAQLRKFAIAAAVLSWLAVTTVSASERAGRDIYVQWCEQCHADSPFAPGTIQLKASRGAAQSVLLDRKDLNPALIRSFVRDGFGGMPNFRRTEISAAELAVLIEFLVAP